MHSRLGRREFLAGLAGVAVTAPIQDGSRKSRDTKLPACMYVGSYTSEARGHGEGISVYRRNQPSDAWSLVQVLEDFADPSFLTIDRQGRCLYSAHGDGTQATAYRIDAATGRLTVINQQPTGGVNGVHLAIDGTNRFLALANYASGTLVVMPRNEDGSLGPVSDRAAMTGEPGPHRTQQESSHPHHCPFDRAGRFIVVPDKGLDKIFVYRLDASSGKLAAANPPSIAARAGAAPRHVDFHPTRPFAYVINEIDSTITTYQFEPEKGVLKPLQIMSTPPATYTGNNTTAEIWVAPSGRFVYGSNRGHDSIAIFAVDEPPSRRRRFGEPRRSSPEAQSSGGGRTGMLSAVGWESTQGRTPRYFGLDPSRTHLYAANQNSDTVVIFRVNQTTGKLTPTGEVIKVGSPSTIVFR
jgi:6-phosphogluconolactonase (cycloisomerase 2 family)